MAVHEMDLDLLKGGTLSPHVIVAHVGDSGEVLKATISRGGAPADLGGCQAHLMAARPDRTYFEQAMAVSGSTATATVDPRLFGAPGTLRTAYVRVTGPGGLTETSPDVIVHVLPDAEGCSEGLAGPYSSAVEELARALRAEAERAAGLSSSVEREERLRKSAEEARDAAEKKRAEAEASRSDQHSQRMLEASSATAAAGNAASAAQGAASNAQNAASTCLQIANAAAAGSAGSGEVARLKASDEALWHQVAELTQAWHVSGETAYAPASKATVSGTSAALPTSTASGTTVNAG